LEKIFDEKHARSHARPRGDRRSSAIKAATIRFLGRPIPPYTLDVKHQPEDEDGGQNDYYQPCQRAKASGILCKSHFNKTPLFYFDDSLSG
jgi:hypothetical protein